MKRPIALLLILLFYGCNQFSAVSQLFDTAEICIYSAPDKALSILDGIDTAYLKSSDLKARYALLKTMAIENNFIRNRNLKLLYPAIKYYAKYGNPTEKLRTYYHYGLICKRLHNNNSAMNCFIKGIEDGRMSDDFLTLAKLYSQKAELHKILNEPDKHIECYKISSNLFLKTNDNIGYFNSQVQLLYGYLAQKDHTQCCKLLQNIENCTKANMTLVYLNKYYDARVRYESMFSKSTLLSTISEYLQIIPHNKISWLAIASAYLNIQDYDKGINALIEYINNRTTTTLSMEYYLLACSLYEKAHEYPKALSVYKEYTNQLKEIYEQDTKFVEERFYLQQATNNIEKRKKNLQWYATVAIILLSSIILYISSRLKINSTEKKIIEKDKENYRLLSLQLEEEKDNLTELLSAHDTLSDEARKSIIERLELLNKFFAARITSNENLDKKAYDELEFLIGNKKEFIESTIHSFEISHPHFILYLQEKNLTQNEIGYCCLFAIGLKGKEIGTYTNMSRHYAVSSMIRKKLGIDSHETNLNLYIKTLLES